MKYSFDDIRPPRKKRHPRPAEEHEAETSSSPLFARPKKTHPGAVKSERNSWFRGATPRAANERKGPSGGGSRLILWSMATLAIFLVVVAAMGLFTGATVEVTPQQEHTVIDGEFTAERKGETGTGLLFETMALAGEETKEVSATEERQVEQKASGQIVIYNAYSAADQPLIKNTRFETPDGKIYRIRDSVTVPGMTTVDGKKVPGSLEVTVYADEPGESYNIGLTDFTVPGFKGYPQYENFYARSKTEMTGGFSGKAKFPSETDLALAGKELEEKLRDTLTTEANAQVPENFILYPDAIFISYDDLEVPTAPQGGTITVKRRATVRGIIFAKEDLERFIAEQSLASYDPGQKVWIKNIEELEFKILDRDGVTASSEKISFSLHGNPQIIWSIDEGLLIDSLRGIAKKRFYEVLGAFPQIKRAEASIYPFWKQSFPDDAKDIQIKQIIE